MELEACQSELAVATADRKLVTEITHSGQRQLATLQEAVRNERQQLLDERETRIRAETALVNEQTARIQLETQLKSLQGIAPATVPSLMEAFTRLAQLTDKVMPVQDGEGYGDDMAWLTTCTIDEELVHRSACNTLYITG